MRDELYLGNCLEIMRSLPDNSVDTMITDPPYGLSDHKDVSDVLRAWILGEEYQPKGKGFMGKEWDSFVPPPSIWKECLRVLKPGGMAFVFAGTRSFDLMAISMRLAGFEIKDSIWHGLTTTKRLRCSKPKLGLS